MRIFSVLLFIGCSLVSCKPKSLSLDELNKFILDEDNGLIKSNEINGLRIGVTYRPTDLWIHQETKHLATPPSQQKLDSLQKKYEGQLYFVVSLSQNKKEALHQASSFGQYSELVQTLSFRMAEYVTLTTTAQDTVPLSDFILNRTYGMSNATELLFVFNKQEAVKHDWLQVNINEFGMGSGNQRFRFKTADLLTAPRLEF